MKTVEVKTEIIISAPRDKVAEYAANPDNAPIWYDNITSAEWKSPKPIQSGSLITFTANFLGKKLVYTYEIFEYVPGEKLVMGTTGGQMQMNTTYLWETAEGNNTRMTLINKGGSSGFSAIFSPIMKIAMRKAMEKNLKDLKKILEN